MQRTKVVFISNILICYHTFIDIVVIEIIIFNGSVPLTLKELLTLPEQFSSSLGFSWVCIARSFVFCIVFCPLSIFFLLTIALCSSTFYGFDYLFGILSFSLCYILSNTQIMHILKAQFTLRQHVCYVSWYVFSTNIQHPCIDNNFLLLLIDILSFLLVTAVNLFSQPFCRIRQTWHDGFCYFRILGVK